MKTIEEIQKKITERLHITTLVDIAPMRPIDLWGSKHTVYDSEDGKFIELKPLIEQFGLDWLEYQKIFIGVETARVFGVAELLDAPEERLFIKAENIQLFVMLLPFEKMQANGQEKYTELLTSKIEEWAWVIHHYEGTLDRDGRSDHPAAIAQKENMLSDVIQLRQKSEDTSVQAWVDNLIVDLCEELNRPVPKFN